MATQKRFREIIVGGGLVGLTAAHIFSKAGIDFLLLEKHKSVASLFGTLFAFWPQTFRIFDQLGLLEPLQPILEHLNQAFIISAEDGRIIIKDETLDPLGKRQAMKYIMKMADLSG